MKRHFVVTGVSVLLNFVLIGLLYSQRYSCKCKNKNSLKGYLQMKHTFSNKEVKYFKNEDDDRSKIMTKYDNGDEGDEDDDHTVSYINQIKTKDETQEIFNQLQSDTQPSKYSAGGNHKAMIATTREQRIAKAMVDRKSAKAHIYTWNETWREAKVCNTAKDFNLATLTTFSGNTPIFVYDAKSDVYISSSLLANGRWETEIAMSLHSIFDKDPDLAFVDIGGNLGVFTLQIAKSGRPVIAVEPLRSNIQRLCRSVQEGNLSSLVTLIYNAVSDKHEEVTLGKDKNNVGGTFVNKNNDIKINQSKVSGVYSQPVNTIVLDDLLSLPINIPPKVAMKIDVEGYEIHVVQGANKFFETVNVTAVLMEWTYSNNPKYVDTIRRFMAKHNLFPYGLRLTNDLSTIPHSKWPSNIVWMKKIVRNKIV